MSWETYFRNRATNTENPALKSFYQQLMPDPDTEIQDLSFVAIDLETTGLDPEKHGITSIGMVPFTLSRIRPDQGFYSVLKPKQPLKAVTIHRITHSDVSDAPDFSEVLPEIIRHMYGKVPVVHYHPIERGFLNQTAKSRLGEEWLFPLIDTMELEARLHRRRWSLRRLLGKHKSIRLAESRLRYGLPQYQGHHAKLDALATAELFTAQLAWHYSPETLLADLWQ